jgi:septum formation protein
MLEPILYKLVNSRVILASNSPRRKEIFAQACPNLPLEIVPSNAEENLDPQEYADTPWTFAIDTARLKATEVFERISNQVSHIEAQKLR